MRCWLGGRKGIRRVKKLSGEVLALLSQCVCVCVIQVPLATNKDVSSYEVIQKLCATYIHRGLLALAAGLHTHNSCIHTNILRKLS